MRVRVRVNLGSLLVHDEQLHRRNALRPRRVDRSGVPSDERVARHLVRVGVGVGVSSRVRARARARARGRVRG